MDENLLDPNGIVNNYSPEDIESIPQQPSETVQSPPQLLVQQIHLRNNATVRAVRNIEDATMNPYGIPNFPDNVTHFLKISNSVTSEDFGNSNTFPNGFHPNPSRVLLIPIRDRYGMLSYWNGSRNRVSNPGANLSRFSTPIPELGNIGAPRKYMQEQEDWIDYPSPIQQQIIEDINKINNGEPVNVLPGTQPRKSARLAGERAPSIALNECQGKECIITRTKIQNYGIKLSDGQCYDVNALIQWYMTNNTTSPMRKPYTPEDREKIEEWINRRGGKRKSRKTKKQKTKTRKVKKTKTKAKRKTKRMKTKKRGLKYNPMRK